MRKQTSLFLVAALAAASLAGARQPSAPEAQPADQAASAQPAKVCKYVVDDQPGSKPYQLCMTKAEWQAKELADSRDATRTVCKYQDVPGTRFRSAKVCMTAAQWDEHRRLEREAIEQIQRNVCVAGAGC